MDLGITKKVAPLIDAVRDMVSNEIEPLDAEFHAEVGKHPSGDRFQHTDRQLEILDQLKATARERGLWNFWLTDSEKGYGLTTVEYAYLAEEMGKVSIAAEIFNCNAPDTGNMEVLERYGTDEHKNRWLYDLLDGKIRSAYVMTEPNTASSDAAQLAFSAVKEGDDWLLNGEKWWISGAGDPRCGLYILLACTDPAATKHSRHTMFVIDPKTPGIEVLRPMQVFGNDDAPHGHMHLRFKNVRIPASSIVLGEGRGFEIAQGRLGPGRIHHCMRTIGVAERALDILCERATNREAFGKPLAELGGNYDVIADCRIEIDSCRLLTLNAAHMMDTVGNKIAKSEIAQIKVAVPNMALRVIDKAIQIHGGAGVSQDTPLARMYASMRTLRLADGPDEVHRRTVARLELGKHQAQAAKDGSPDVYVGRPS